jgi:hypothetical protein
MDPASVKDTGRRCLYLTGIWREKGRERERGRERGTNKKEPKQEQEGNLWLLLSGRKERGRRN